MKRLVVGLLLLLSAHGAHAQQVMDGTENQIQDVPIVELIRDRLIEFAAPDPYASQLIKLRHSKTNADLVCGQVNLKNRGGGFDGFAPFVYDTKGNRLSLNDMNDCQPD